MRKGIWILLIFLTWYLAGMYAGEGEERRLILGSGGEEIRQLREYAAGDPYRLIHWNQTARTDVLWVKEYEPESERSVVIYLDFFRSPFKQDIPLDAFWEILWAFLEGMLAAGIFIQVRWTIQGGYPAEQRIVDLESCEQLLLQLYCLEKIDWTARVRTEEETDFRLGLDLILYRGSEPLVQFTKEGYEEELER